MTRYRLKDLIAQESWTDIVGLDPDLVVWALSFDDCLRLAYALAFFDDQDQGVHYAVRLLYTLRRYTPEHWNSSWKHDALIGTVCNLGYMEKERYYAYLSASTKVTPLPGALAVALAGCTHMPEERLVSDEEAYNLYQYALNEHPFLNALIGIRAWYREVGGKEDDIAILDEKIKSVEDKRSEEPDVNPSAIYEPFSFDSLRSNIDVSLKPANSQEVEQWIARRAWCQFEITDPRCILGHIPFEDTLRLCYQMLQDGIQAQNYSIRLLYALRNLRFADWGKDWRHDAFLGYACELSHKYDEQFSGYLQATSYIREIPPNLKIALAGCYFVPNTFMPQNRAIRYLQEAIHEKPYIDALFLLRRIYIQQLNTEGILAIEQTIQRFRGEDESAPSMLPPCIHKRC